MVDHNVCEEQKVERPGMVDFCDGNPFTFGTCCDDRAPGVDDNGVSEGSSLGVVTADLSCGDDVTLVLNGPELSKSICFLN